MGQSTTSAPGAAPNVERRRKSSGLSRRKKPLMKLVAPPTAHPFQVVRPASDESTAG